MASLFWGVYHDDHLMMRDMRKNKIVKTGEKSAVCTSSKISNREKPTIK